MTLENGISSSKYSISGKTIFGRIHVRIRELAIFVDIEIIKLNDNPFVNLYISNPIDRYIHYAII